MLRKELFGSGLAIIVILSMFAGLIAVLPGAEAAAPTFSTWSIEPAEPTFDSSFNITVTFVVTDEQINMVEIQVCHGKFGLCEEKVEMTDTGDGLTFFREFPEGGFGETGDVVPCYFHVYVTYGTGSQFHYPEDLGSNELGFNITRVATSIEVTAEPDVTTLFPDETVTVTGKVMDDLGENVSDADVNLSVTGENIFSTTMTDMQGNFSASVTFPQDGNFELNLTVEKDGMMSYDMWDITVNSWPLPDLSISGEILHDTADLIPGEEGLTFYKGTELELVYRVSNTGTGTAFNITSILNITNMEEVQEDIGNLTPSPTQRYEGVITLNTSQPGYHAIKVNITWDQEAPSDLKSLVQPLHLNFTIKEPPTWEDHTVLVEMFTQTTCVPCVDVEEALEWLDQEIELEFNLMMYVFEDQASELKATELGVTSTPDVFIDHTYNRISGGGVLESLKEQFRSEIENASKRDTPPLSIDFTEEGGEMKVSLQLGWMFQEELEGIFQVYSIEKHSNIRNHQGIPISHRYHGVVDGMSVDSFIPGSYRNLTVPRPDLGMGYIAVMLSPDGKVLQSTSFFNEDEPGLFMKDGDEIMRITTPGSDVFNVTLERFQFMNEEFDDIDYQISISGIRQNITVELDGSSITEEPSNLKFSYGDTGTTQTDSGRYRYHQKLLFTVIAPEGASGNAALTMRINDSGFIYTYKVLVIMTPEDGMNITEDPVITDVYLEGAGGILYLWVEAEDVPDDALVKVRVLPCNYGDNAVCGIPKDFTLVKQEEGRYRTSITGVDLETFTHLTFNAWIESGGVKLVEAEEKQDKIADHISPSEVEEDPDPDDPTLMIMIIIGAALLLFIVAAVIFAIVKKNSSRDMAEEQQEPEEVQKEAEEDLGDDRETADETSDETKEDLPEDKVPETDVEELRQEEPMADEPIMEEPAADEPDVEPPSEEDGTGELEAEDSTSTYEKGSI